MPEKTEASRAERPIWIYLALVFPLSWALWLPAIRNSSNPVFLDLGGGPALAAMWVAAWRGGHTRNPARVLAFAAGLPICWLVASLNVAASHNPPALQFQPGLLLPSAISAWILSGAFSADKGVRSLLRGLVAPPDWRWPLITLLMIPAFLGITAVAGGALGLPVAHPAAGLTTFQFTGLAAVRFFHYFLFASLFEEPGWRGFLLPRLQARFSPLMAAILVWIPWAIWHLPLDLNRPGGAWSLRLIVQQRGVALLLFSIWITWLYNRSRGSLLSAAVFHGATGSFLYVLPSSAPVIVPLGLVLAVSAVVSSRMWRPIPRL